MITGPTHCAGDHQRDRADEQCCRRERDRWLHRRLLERQLHDGAALRISALTLRLGLLRNTPLPDAQAVQNCIGELQEELHAVLEELREVATRIYPPLLDEAGLGPALREFADRLGVPVAVVTSGERFGPAAEGAGYFAVTGWLAALPAGAPVMEVVIRRENDELLLSVPACAACHAHLLEDQVWPLGGTVDQLDGDRPGTGTITARIPCG